MLERVKISFLEVERLAKSPRALVILPVGVIEDMERICRWERILLLLKRMRRRLRRSSKKRDAYFVRG